MWSIEQEIRQFIIDNFLFGEPETELSNDDSLLDQGIIDSMGVLELVTFLEDKYEVEIQTMNSSRQIWILSTAWSSLSNGKCMPNALPYDRLCIALCLGARASGPLLKPARRLRSQEDAQALLWKSTKESRCCRSKRFLNGRSRNSLIKQRLSVETND
jgi:acyl carrier protein